MSRHVPGALGESDALCLAGPALLIVSALTSVTYPVHDVMLLRWKPLFAICAPRRDLR